MSSKRKFSLLYRFKQFPLYNDVYTIHHKKNKISKKKAWCLTWIPDTVKYGISNFTEIGLRASISSEMKINK